MNEILGAVKRAALMAAFVLLLFTACEGPMGPSGQHAQGVDVIPPTIELVQPHPLSQVWDEFTIAASAVDNVAIREVVFTFDGSYIINNQVLFDDEPPYEVTIEAVDGEGTRWFESGWHFVSARAYDTAGNLTDAPVVPIQLGFSEDLQDTIVMAFHNGVPDREWTLPDTAGATAYWVRFNTPKRCRVLSVDLYYRQFLRHIDSICIVGIWNGDLFPDEDDMLGADTLFWDYVPDTSISYEPVIHLSFLNNGEIMVSDDFFVMIELVSNDPADSIVLMVDDGLPPWRRCGSRDDDGLHSLIERYGVENNFMVSCSVFYEDSSPPPEEVSNGGTGFSNE